ncbi:MAG TPA: HAMP domain-containing sensor histidine kinase [Acidimicrobiia bacterium]|nr:HAMP domain-containing sensor histidine kinase [Acidimicrobiia bacterium]
MANLRGVLDRFAAPVDFGPIRPWTQLIRGGVALTILIGCTALYLSGETGVVVPALAAAFDLTHVVLRGRRHAGITESLLVDAACLLAATSVLAYVDQILVAATAFLLSAALVFGGARSALAVMSGFGVMMGLRFFVLPVPDPVYESHGGVLVWASVTVLLIGVVVALLASGASVAAARSKQETAHIAERRAAEMKTEFVSMVTHELRTPLTNIAGFAMTLRDSWEDLPREDADEFLRIIVGEAEHLANIVEDVLAIPRLEAGKLLVETTDFALQPAAFRITDLIFPAGGDRSASVSISGKVRVHADPNRVEQILRNLLENAKKYGGDEVLVDATRNGDEWVVTVSDNGLGVPAEHRERIFGVFEQASNGDARTSSGFGLGLAVARHLVEAMGGRIWYEPGFPVGARFCFTLPAAMERLAAEPAA